MIDTNKKNYHQNIIDYYQAGEVSYRDVWDLDNSMAIHFGYWDATTRTFPQSLLRFNEVLMQLANITRKDKVLDAGCGVGGSSIYLAQHTGCTATGITLSEQQVQKAQQNAQQKEVAHLVNFEAADYTQTHFPDESFDVVWALESVCYALDKADFIKEAFRLLKKGGRLIVADGFAADRIYNDAQKQIMDNWCHAWALKELVSMKTFEKVAVDTGFTQTYCKDVSQQVMHSSRRLYRLSLLAAAVGRMHKLVGKNYGNYHTLNNGKGAYYQYKAMKQGLWQYGIFYGEKS